MEQNGLIIALVGFLVCLLCCGTGILFLLLILGFVILRRRGQECAKTKAAVSVGAETVSQVFVRGQGGLEALGDDDDDD